MKKSKVDFIRFVASIKKVTSKIDVVGDKVADMTLNFLATDETLAEVNALQKPDTNVEVCMRIEK